MKKRFRNILFLCLLLIAAGGAAYLFWYQSSLEKNADVYEEARREVKEETKKEPEETESAEMSKPEIPIDFDALWEINPDAYAWIVIPGTSVDYPILQSPTDDQYYLDHNLDGSEGYPGSIYTQRYNGTDFQDFNTVIYGHNMKDKSMFGDLHRYEDSSFMRENSRVIVYTPEKILTYQIFAAVVYDDRHILLNYDFTQMEDRQAFLDSLNMLRDMRSNIDSTVEAGPDDRILTLSTCIGSEDHHRYLVEAVLIDEQS